MTTTTTIYIYLDPRWAVKDRHAQQIYTYIPYYNVGTHKHIPNVLYNNMCEHEVDSSGTEYMHVHVYPHACACLYTTLYEYHIYCNIWAGQCRVQLHVECDPNNHVRGIIRPGVICTQPHSYCQKNNKFYAYVQLSRLS